MTSRQLVLDPAHIQTSGDRSRLLTDIHWDHRTRTLWFEVERQYEHFLCPERLDGFLVALLPFAMLNNLDIQARGCVSERLLYQINTLLLPTLHAHIPAYHRVQLNVTSHGSRLPSHHGVATGLSCGVDSFYTVLKHLATPTRAFDLTHLTYFNIMNTGLWQTHGEDSSRDFSNMRVTHVKRAAAELGLPLIAVDSNLDVFYRAHSLLATYTFRYLGTVLALQTLFSKYYWSSAYPFSQFNLTEGDTGHFDFLSVYALSQDNTLFYPTGSETTRLNKTAYISDFPITHRHLNVCWHNLYNCNRCSKCRRTMLTLYALKKLDSYGDVFDVDYFYRHIDDYFGYMIFMRSQDDRHSYFQEIHDYLVDQGIEISSSAKARARQMARGSPLQRLSETVKILAGPFDRAAERQ